MKMMTTSPNKWENMSYWLRFQLLLVLLLQLVPLPPSRFFCCFNSFDSNKSSKSVINICTLVFELRKCKNVDPQKRRKGKKNPFYHFLPSFACSFCNWAHNVHCSLYILYTLLHSAFTIHHPPALCSSQLHKQYFFVRSQWNFFVIFLFEIYSCFFHSCYEVLIHLLRKY